MLKCNCNHFSEAMLRQLNPAWVFPQHINRAAGVGGSVAGAFGSLFKKITRATPAPGPAQTQKKEVKAAR